MAGKKEKTGTTEIIADLEKRISALKTTLRTPQETAPAGPQLRALRKKLRRAQRRRRSLTAFAKSLAARRAGKKVAAPAPAAPAAE